jgi:hypothetical protein
VYPGGLAVTRDSRHCEAEYADMGCVPGSCTHVLVVRVMLLHTLLAAVKQSLLRLRYWSRMLTARGARMACALCGKDDSIRSVALPAASKSTPHLYTTTKQLTTVHRTGPQ